MKSSYYTFTFNTILTFRFINKNKQVTIESCLRSLSVVKKRGMTRALKVPFNTLQLLTVEPPVNIFLSFSWRCVLNRDVVTVILMEKHFFLVETCRRTDFRTLY